MHNVKARKVWPETCSASLSFTGRSVQKADYWISNRAKRQINRLATYNLKEKISDAYLYFLTGKSMFLQGRELPNI